jgi:hypothetical protein
MAIDLNFTQLQFLIQDIPIIPWSFISSFSFIALGIFICLTVAYFLIKLVLIYRVVKSPHTLLEIKPPKETEQSPYSTQQLFNLFYSIANQRSFIEKIFNVKKPLSFEIVSTKEKGIRYVMRIPKTLAELIKNSLISYLPGIEVEETNEYLSLSNINTSVVQLSLSSHFAFPLKTHEVLEKNDPIAYLTGSMTKLKPDDLMAYQLVLAPVSKKSVPEIARISKLIYLQKDLRSGINNNPFVFSWLQILFNLILQVLLLPIGLLVFVATEGREGPLLRLSQLAEKEKTSNPYQNETEKLVKQKLDQQLFSVSIRVLVKAKSKRELSKRQKGFVSALTSMTNTQYQSLKLILKTNIKIVNQFKYFLFKHRLLLPLTKTIISASELGDLYHFPFTRTTKTEDIQKQFSKGLPAPLSLKKTNQLDITFAKNTYGGTTTLIGLTEDERRRHMYILGATGTGKSTMLLSMINSDLKNGIGIAVLDPHGDLIEEILNIIPKSRVKDVVYFNPDDIAYPMGINLLELSKGLNEEDTLREKEFVTESIISLFHKVYGEKYTGPRLEYILRNAIHTAFTVKGATLFTVNKLLINSKFRKSVVKKLTDEDLKEFWKQEFDKAGDYQQVSMVLPITNKIGRFLFSPTAKRILEQEKSTIDFDEIMNEGKILLCNLSKGKIGEDNSKVLGIVMMAKLQLSSLKRARMKVEDRRDYYLYVDEFQNFATESFAQILSEARKYKLGAILAHQTTSQLEDQSLVNITLANTGTVICFRTANPEDEKVILPQFRPYVEQGEIASLPSYRFYMRLGALNPEAPFSGITMPVDIKRDEEFVKRVIDSSRENYAIRYVESPKKQKEVKFSINIKKKYKKANSYSALP